MSKQRSGVRGQRSEVGGRRSAILMLAVVTLMTVCSVWAGDVVNVRARALESREQLAVPLPPLATIAVTDETKKTWQQTGTMVGSIDVVRADFRHSLRAGGWKLDKAIAVGRSANRSELMIWTNRGHRILMMLWEKETGLCGFSWGEER